MGSLAFRVDAATPIYNSGSRCRIIRDIRVLWLPVRYAGAAVCGARALSNLCDDPVKRVAL